VRDPVAFLLDEPLSNLDVKLRLQMRGELVDLHKRTGRTFVYVTHDQAEAMSMSDQIAVMLDGRIVQSGTPREIYERPATRDIAAFVGDHPLNLVEVATRSEELPPPFASFALDARPESERILIGLRPEALFPSADGLIAGKVVRLEYLGSSAVATVAVSGGETMRAILPAHSLWRQPGEETRLAFNPDQAHLFDASTGARLAIRLVPRLPQERPEAAPA